MVWCHNDWFLGINILEEFVVIHTHATLTTLKVEVVSWSETLGHLYHFTWHHFSDDSNPEINLMHSLMLCLLVLWWCMSTNYNVMLGNELLFLGLCGQRICDISTRRLLKVWIIWSWGMDFYGGQVCSHCICLFGWWSSTFLRDRAYYITIFQ